jgi:hypothetical protein
MTTTSDKPTTLVYPEYCPYCTKKYNTTSCLLPYALVSLIELPQDQTDQAIELTELHCSFKAEYLRYYADLTHWHKSHSDPTNGSVFGPTHNWVVHNDSLPPSRLTSTVASTSQSGIPLTEAAHQPHQTPEPQTQLTTEAIAPQVTTNMSTTTDTHSDLTPVTAPQSKSPLTAANLEQLNAASFSSEKLSTLTLADALHLANDTVLALVTAQNLRKKKRTKITLNDLYESLNTELTTADHLGMAYKPKSSTPLDHPIALAREIIAHHDIDTVYNWLDPDSTLSCSHKCCLLNFKRIAPNYVHSPTELRLDNHLLLFAKHSVSHLLKDKSMKKHSTRALNNLLAERFMPTSFDWLTTSPLDKLYLDDHVLLTTEKNLSLFTTPHQSSHKLPLKESSPPIDSTTSKLLSESLPTIVSAALSSKALTLSNISPHLREEIFIIQLSNYTVRHNPRWNTPTFCVTTHMIENALKSSGSHASALEILHLSYGMTDILTKLRDSQSQTKTSTF